LTELDPSHRLGINPAAPRRGREQQASSASTQTLFGRVNALVVNDLSRRLQKTRRGGKKRKSESITPEKSRAKRDSKIEKGEGDYKPVVLRG